MISATLGHWAADAESSAERRSIEAAGLQKQPTGKVISGADMNKYICEFSATR